MVWSIALDATRPVVAEINAAFDEPRTVRALEDIEVHGQSRLTNTETQHLGNVPLAVEP
jgi:hypothetical protein